MISKEKRLCIMVGSRFDYISLMSLFPSKLESRVAAGSKFLRSELDCWPDLSGTPFRPFSIGRRFMIVMIFFSIYWFSVFILRTSSLRLLTLPELRWEYYRGSFLSTFPLSMISLLTRFLRSYACISIEVGLLGSLGSTIFTVLVFIIGVLVLSLIRRPSI